MQFNTATATQSGQTENSLFVMQLSVGHTLAVRLSIFPCLYFLSTVRIYKNLPINRGGPPCGRMGGGGGKFIIVDKGGGGGADVIGFVPIEGGGGMAVVGGRFVSGFSWSGTFGPIRSLSSDGLESNSEHKVSSE